jgi:hypothetical protein
VNIEKDKLFPWRLIQMSDEGIAFWVGLGFGLMLCLFTFGIMDTLTVYKSNAHNAIAKCSNYEVSEVPDLTREAKERILNNCDLTT